MLAGEGATEAIALRVADARVGELRLRPRAAPPAPVLLRMVTTLIGQEVDRARAPERASEAAVADFLSDLLSRKVTDRENMLARAEELGCDLADGAAVIVARARPSRPRRATGARGCSPSPPAGRARRRAHVPGRGHRARPAAAAARRAGRARRPARDGDPRARPGRRTRRAAPADADQARRWS